LLFSIATTDCADALCAAARNPDVATTSTERGRLPLGIVEIGQTAVDSILRWQAFVASRPRAASVPVSINQRVPAWRGKWQRRQNNLTLIIWTESVWLNCTSHVPVNRVCEHSA